MSTSHWDYKVASWCLICIVVHMQQFMAAGPSIILTSGYFNMRISTQSQQSLHDTKLHSSGPTC